MGHFKPGPQPPPPPPKPNACDTRYMRALYRTNPKDLRKYFIPGTRCCCPPKFFFGVMPYAKMGSAKKIAKIIFNNIFCPSPPFYKNARIVGEFAPLLVAPLFRVSCPILHLALLSENDESGTRPESCLFVRICAMDCNPRVQLIHICMPM